MKVFTKAEVLELLETQRGNCYVAVLSTTGSEEIAETALRAPIPGGEQFDLFHKGTGVKKLYKKLYKSK